MASLSYATTGTGLLAGGIGWINFGALTLAAGASQTNLTATLRDGSILKFDIANTTISGGGASFTATVPPTFGVNGYTGISGNVVLYSSPITGTSRITLSNISVTDPFGVPVPNYTLYLADGEATGTGESIISTTNGGNWTLFTTVGSGVSPTVSGIGTQTVSYTGSGGTYISPISSTTNATNVFSNLSATSGGREGVVFGISINKVSLNKVITSRFSSSDQFTLNLSGSVSATTTTFGSTYGAQPVSAYVFPTSPGTFTLSEVLASGSGSTLSQYSSTIAYTNLTPGGTTVPSSNTLPGTVNLNSGDVVVATITNSPILPTLTTTKSSPSFSDINNVVTYTITFTNNGTVTLNNVLLLDTIPSGTTFVPNSLTINGISTSANPTPPTGANIGNIPAGATFTATFNVLVGSSVPSPNPFINNSSSSFSYTLFPTSGTGSTSSNSTSTRVNAITLSSSKQVNKVFANIGDILTYTVSISAVGNTIANNVVFVDTIPSGTTFIPGSSTINGTTFGALNPNPPGFTITGGIAPNTVTTVSFKVQVTTIPSPNPIPNSATVNYSYTIDPSTPIAKATSTNTNIANTKVNNANLSNISKSVDKSFAECNDILTYTILIPNVGNTTALNILFKDTIPNGTVFVPNSLTINGITQSGANPSTGVSIPDINPSSTTTVTFQVQVQC